MEFFLGSTDHCLPIFLVAIEVLPIAELVGGYDEEGELETRENRSCSSPGGPPASIATPLCHYRTPIVAFSGTAIQGGTRQCTILDVQCHGAPRQGAQP